MRVPKVAKQHWLLLVHDKLMIVHGVPLPLTRSRQNKGKCWVGGKCQICADRSIGEAKRQMWRLCPWRNFAPVVKVPLASHRKTTWNGWKSKTRRTEMGWVEIETCVFFKTFSGSDVRPNPFLIKSSRSGVARSKPLKKQRVCGLWSCWCKIQKRWTNLNLYSCVWCPLANARPPTRHTSASATHWFSRRLLSRGCSCLCAYIFEDFMYATAKQPWQVVEDFNPLPGRLDLQWLHWLSFDSCHLCIYVYKYTYIERN